MSSLLKGLVVAVAIASCVASEFVFNLILKRKQTVDDKYIKDLYERMSTLYHLDELNMKSGIKIDFDNLPTGSVVLISTIGTVWIAIGAYYIVKLIKKRKNSE